MIKKILKKTFPIQYLYPNNLNVYRFVEDYYTIFEGELDGTKACFYNRNKSIVKQTTDGGLTYTDIVDFENPNYFIALDCTFDDIKDRVVTSDDGLLEWIE